MSCGTPVITFDVEGIVDLIKYRKTSPQVTADNVSSLEAGIGALAAQPERTGDFTRAARARIELKFKSKMIATRMKPLYEKNI